MKDIFEMMIKGNRSALARVLTDIENDNPSVGKHLTEISSHRNLIPVIGITGAAGSGKSSIISRLISFYRQAGKKIGVIAVDPSSHKTGGAVLGDRIRMQGADNDDGVYIRSVAARGMIEGLGLKLLKMFHALELFGLDAILLETIGAGQDETSVINYADAVVLVMTPDEGDDIQLLKAGKGEIGDILVINKSDRPHYHLFESKLRSVLEMSCNRNNVPLIGTMAEDGTGCIELFNSIEECVKNIGDLTSHRNPRYRNILLSEQLVDASYREKKRLLCDPLFNEKVENILEGKWHIDNPPAAVAIDHIAIACDNMEKLEGIFTRILGFNSGALETVESEKVMVRFIESGETHIELLETLDPRGPIGKYLDKKGAGLHHIALRVNGLDELLKRVRENSIRILGDIRQGASGKRIIFLHPSDTGNVLIELSE